LRGVSCSSSNVSGAGATYPPGYRTFLSRAVCRCLRGACRSETSIWSMCAITGPSRGTSLTTAFRSGGIAFPIGCRTIRRCTPCFLDSP
jgi:hypothetical protein